MLVAHLWIIQVTKFNELQRKNQFTRITLLQHLFVIPNVHWFLQVQLSITKAKHILYHQIQEQVRPWIQDVIPYAAIISNRVILHA